MKIRSISVIFIFVVGLIGVLSAHACAQPDPIDDGIQREPSQEVVPGGRIVHEWINRSRQSPYSGPLPRDSRSVSDTSIDRHDAIPGRAEK
jgi:hypothetical protein